MLIGIYEFMQKPQRFIPSIVWLNRLDVVNGICGNLAIRKTLKPICISTITGGFENREIRDSPVVSIFQIDRRAAMFGNKFPHSIVGGRTTVCNAVADEDAKKGRNGLCEACTCGAILIDIGDDDLLRMFINMPLNFGAKQLEVLLCPDDFES
jgi:hypothetical protein